MQTDLLPHAFFSLKDGGSLRYARLDPSTTVRGTVLIIPGRREFLEKKYVELGQPLLNRGLRVFILEMRNQGLSARVLSPPLAQRDHIDDFNTHIDDIRAFFDAVIAPDLAAPFFFHGHSLGAHIGLRWLAEDTVPVRAAFLTSPMLALSTMPAQMAAHGISWFNVRVFGHTQEYAPMQHDYGGDDRLFADNVLTQDAERFPIIDAYFSAHPSMAVGGVTWGWLFAALRSMHLTHALPYLGRISVPVLALVGGEDRVTPAKDISHYLNYVPRMRTQNMVGSRHDILNEVASVRHDAWQKIHAFLDEFVSS